MKMTVEDSGSGMVLKVVPKLEDFVGNYSGKTISQEAINILDKMRSEDLY